MKKFFAFMLTLALVLSVSGALAESVTWEEVGAAAVETYGLEGDFVSLSELGLAIWLPSTLGAAEVSEEDAAAGRYLLFVDQDQECYLAVDTINVEGMTLDQAYQNAVDNGMTGPEIVNINGLSAVTYADETNNIGCVVLVDTNSNMIIFSFGPFSEEGADMIFYLICSSIMPLE